MDLQHLEGLWRYVTNEEGGVARSSEQVATMAILVFLPGDYLPDWHGLWAAVQYGYEGGTWSAAEVKANCRHIILGSEREGPAPPSDFYLWAGGRFRVGLDQSPQEIDFEQYWRGAVLEPTMQLGLYRTAENQLFLCLAATGRPRPSGFTSSEHSNQSLATLVLGAAT